MRRRETTALVVGAGPVGLITSILLTRLGIDNIVVERRRDLHRAPQAHVINPRSLEICRMLGVDMDRLQDLATPAGDGGFTRWVSTLAGEEFGALPYERQGTDCSGFTPTPLLNLSQHLFEPVLLDRFLADDGKEVLYGHQWQSFASRGDTTRSVVRDLASDEEYEVESRYVLAADGAGSRVRKALGIEMVGPQSLQSFIMIHFRANLRALVRERPAILYWTLSPEIGAFIAHDIESNWVYMHSFDPASDPAEGYDAARCAEILRRAIGGPVDLEVETISPWHMTSQIAEHYQEGATFLVGDSAHRFPPSGGLGMNSGIQDAHNAVWKIAAVERGFAGRSLLETYGTERQPVAQRNADASLENAMKLVAVPATLGINAPGDPIQEGAAARSAARAAIDEQQDHFDMLGLQLGFSYDSPAIEPDGTDLPIPANPIRDLIQTSRPGSRFPHAWVRHDGKRKSTLDLLPYESWTLVLGSDAAAEPGWLTRLGDPVRSLVVGRDFTLEGEALPGIGARTAVLVRPDQHVAWRGHDGAEGPDLERILGRAG